MEDKACMRGLLAVFIRLRKHITPQLQVQPKKAHGEPSSSQNKIVQALLLVLRTGNRELTLILSKSVHARFSLRNFAPLRMNTALLLQVASKKAHGEPSSQTRSCRRCCSACNLTLILS